MKSKTFFVAAFAVLVLVAAACGGGDDTADATDAAVGTPGVDNPADEAGGGDAELTGTVFLLVPNSQTVRFLRYDAPQIEASLAERAPGVQLEVLNAENDANRQLQQAESALAQEALGLILISVDPEQSAGITQRSSDAGVPLISYAHESKGGPVEYHVTVPFRQIGHDAAEFMVENVFGSGPQAPDGTIDVDPEGVTTLRLAKILGDPNFFFYTEQQDGRDEVLDEFIEQGAIEIVCEADSLQYDPQNARTAMEQCLTSTGNEVDAVIGENDGTLGGAVAALEAQGLAGEVGVYGGYDAELPAVQRILAGQQANTMVAPYALMADTAVQLLVSLITGDEPPADLINGTFDNGFVEGGVPAAILDNVFIYEGNVQETVVDAGLLTIEEICTGIAADTDFCAS